VTRIKKAETMRRRRFVIPPDIPARNRVGQLAEDEIPLFKANLDRQIAAKRDGTNREKDYSRLYESVCSVIRAGSVTVIGEIMKRGKNLAGVLEIDKGDREIWVAKYLVSSYNRYHNNST